MDYRIKVTTGVRRESVTRVKDGRFLVAVKVPRTEGRANLRTRELLAEYFKVPLASIHIRQGQTSSTKTVRVTGK